MEFKRSQFVKASLELNNALSLEPPIDVTLGIEDLIKIIQRDVLPLLEPTDEFSKETGKLLEYVKELPVPEIENPCPYPDPVPFTPLFTPDDPPLIEQVFYDEKEIKQVYIDIIPMLKRKDLMHACIKYDCFKPLWGRLESSEFVGIKGARKLKTEMKKCIKETGVIDVDIEKAMYKAHTKYNLKKIKENKFKEVIKRCNRYACMADYLKKYRGTTQSIQDIIREIDIAYVKLGGLFNERESTWVVRSSLRLLIAMGKVQKVGNAILIGTEF